MPSKAALRQQWKEAGENKVVLHMFPRCKTRTSPSPFVVKLETYLRMAGIDYEPEFSSPMGTKGKCPWITFNGEDYNDSQLVMEMLAEKLDKDLSKNLSAKQRAESRALRLMIEDNFYWVLCTLIVLDKGKSERKVMAPFSGVPGFLQGIMFSMMMKGMTKQIQAQGMGRHSKDEVVKMGNDTMQALSDVLGEDDYFFGQAEPTELDAVVFGFTSYVFANDPEDDLPLIKYAEEKCANLKTHFDRVKAKYYEDWDELMYKEPEKPAKKEKKEEDKEEEKKEGEDGDKKEGEDGEKKEGEEGEKKEGDGEEKKE